MAERAPRPVDADLQVAPAAAITQDDTVGTSPTPAGSRTTLAREAPWRNPEPWWLRGGVRPYLLLADIAAFVVATVITSPTSPVHGVVLLVYLAVFYVAGLYRSRLNLSDRKSVV